MTEEGKEGAEQQQPVEDEDDLSSFGSLRPPSLPPGAAEGSPDEAEADLSALAGSVVAEGNNGLHDVDAGDPEEDATIDLRAAAAAGGIEPGTSPSQAPAGLSAAGKDGEPATEPADGRVPEAERPAGISTGLPAAAPQAPLQPPAAARPRSLLPVVAASFALGLGAGAAIFLAKGWMGADAGQGTAAAPGDRAAPEAEERGRGATVGIGPRSAQSAGETRQASPAGRGAAPGTDAVEATDPAPETPGKESTPTPAPTAVASASKQPPGSARRTNGARKSRREGAIGTPGSQGEGQETTPAAPAERPAGNPGTRSAGVIDELLDDSLDGRAGQSRQDTANGIDLMGGNGLPLTPSREQITEAIRVLLPAIRGCSMGRSGLATASIVIRNTGRVASVSVRGDGFANSPSGRCIEGAVRRARFPEFRQSVFRVTYPLSIQASARDQEVPR